MNRHQAGARTWEDILEQGMWIAAYRAAQMAHETDRTPEEIAHIILAGWEMAQVEIKENPPGEHHV